MVEDDERLQQWNPALEGIREELTFLRKVRGGRMSELAYKLQNPKEMFLPRSRSESRSRSRSNSDIPRTPRPRITTRPLRPHHIFPTNPRTQTQTRPLRLELRLQRNRHARRHRRLRRRGLVTCRPTIRRWRWWPTAGRSCHPLQPCPRLLQVSTTRPVSRSIQKRDRMTP